jgi:hypothetical protein
MKNTPRSEQVTSRHDIAEILLKVALNTKIQIQIPNQTSLITPMFIEMSVPSYDEYERLCIGASTVNIQPSVLD